MIWGRGILDILARLAAEAPDRPALIAPDRRMSRAALHHAVRAQVAALAAAGLPPQARVGVTVEDEWLHLQVTLALMALGCPTLGLPAFRPPAQRQAMAASVGITHLATDAPAQGIAGLAPVTVSARAEAGPLPPLPSGETDGAVMFLTTSGTTGTPKTFARSARMLAAAVGRISGEGPGCILRASTVAHDSSRLGRVMSLLAGQTCAFLDPIRIDTLAEFCVAAGVTEINMGTYRLASLLSAPGAAHPLPAGVRLITGGSRVPGALRQAVAARLTPNLWVSYATSELGLIAMAGPEDHAACPETLGRTIPGVEVSLRDEAGREVAPGTPGRAFVRKPGAPAAYLTGQGGADAGGWFATGDVLSLREDGRLVFHARADDMMILNGINIFPSAIEDVLCAHPDVAEAVAYGIPSTVHGTIPVAAVVLQPDARVAAAALLAHARQRLGLQAPRRITVMDEIPRSALGKPLRRALPR